VASQAEAPGDGQFRATYHQPEPEAGKGRRGAHVAAIAALALGLTGFAVCVTGAANQVLPRRFTASQQRAIVNWEEATRWRELPPGVIFGASVYYAPPSVLDDGTALTLAAARIGIAPQQTCRAAADPAIASVLDAHGCQALLRATYANSTGSYVVTVGVAVLPGTQQARAAQAQLSVPGTGGRRGARGGVRAARFQGTAASLFTDGRRQLSATLSAGPYIVLYTVGYSDGRPQVPVAGDQYADMEMTTLGESVARSVAKVLATPPPVPHCPGAPGC
jgi:hypothetical protein